MGCFNSSGFLSKLPICYGDRVVCFLAKINRNADVYGFCPYYPFSLVSPKCLPVYGRYDDYGAIENIEASPMVDFLENLTGVECEKLFKAVRSSGYSRIKYELEHWGYYNEDTEERERYRKDWEEFLPLLKIYDVEDYPVLLFEHEEIYNKFCEGESTLGHYGDKKTRFETFYDNLDVVSNLFNKYSDKEKYFKNIKISLYGFESCNELAWSVMDYLIDHKDNEDKIDKDFVKNLDKISKETRIKPLLNWNEGSEAFELLNNIDVNTAKNILIPCKDEVRKVCRLYEGLLSLPMYLGLSQTAGQQWYDLKAFDRFLTICKDFNDKKIEEAKENGEYDEEEDE